MLLISKLRIEINDSHQYIYDLQEELSNLRLLLSLALGQSIINYSQRISTLKRKIKDEQASLKCFQKQLQSLICI